MGNITKSERLSVILTKVESGTSQSKSGTSVNLSNSGNPLAVRCAEGRYRGYWARAVDQLANKPARIRWVERGGRTEDVGATLLRVHGPKDDSLHGYRAHQKTLTP